MSELVHLDDEAALDAALVGAKAAALAAARRRGCRALSGFVVPVAHFAELIEQASLLVELRGVHAAQLHVSLTELDPALEAAIAGAARALGERYVVRSSSVVESDPQWSGAFNSYVGVALEELPTAVRGCVASVFRPEIAARLTATTAFDTVAPAVLIQRLLEARCSGTAHVTEDGAREVVAVLGSPVPLLSGWSEGTAATIARDGSAVGPAVELIGDKTVRAVAVQLDVLGASPGTTIEWAAAPDDAGESVFVLQVGRSAARPARTRPRRAGRAPLAPDSAPIAARVARRIAQYGGPLGEELLFPWCLAPGGLPQSIPWPSRAGGREPEHSVASALERARLLGAQLNGSALSRGELDPEALMQRLAARAGDEEFRAVGTMREVDSELVAALWACCGHLRWLLRDRGAISDATPLWALDTAALSQLREGSSGAPLVEDPNAMARWQRLLRLALESSGSRQSAEGAAAGVVAGIARHLRGGDPARALRPGTVIVVDHPLSKFAPLLWRASGLICHGGNESAHLFEVARARRVPAVIVRPRRGASSAELDGSLVLVDGDDEELFVLQGAFSEQAS